jgi:hypothetical protein
MKLRRSLAVRSLLFVLAAAGLLFSGSIGAVQGALQSPPEIVKIEFPPVIPLLGSGSVRVHFRDADGDVTLVQVLPVESVNLIISSWFDPQVRGKAEGSFEFKIQCTPFPSMGAAKVYLRDAAGTWSAPAFFSYVCGVPEHNYDQEVAAVRETHLRVPLNFFFFEDGITELGRNGLFKDEQAPLGEPDPVVRRLIEQVIWPDINGIFDQCALAFELGIVKVLRPDKMRLPSGTTLGSLFIETPIGRAMIQSNSQVRSMLEQAIPTLHQLLKGEGLEIHKDARNIFIVGLREGSLYPGGFGSLPGRIALVTWAAYWFDQTAGQFYKPRQTVRLIAHEVGHNLGLPHIAQRLNLMVGAAESVAFVDYPAALGVGLTKEQCEVVQKNIELPDFPKGA